MFDPDTSHDEALFDEAVTQIRTARPDDAVVAAAAGRVWHNLAGSSAAAAAAEVEEIRGCDDYQKLIPAYLAGSLSPARRTLLEDHSRECVPCRKTLVAARSGAPAPAREPVRRHTRRPRAAWPRQWAMAAALVLGVGLAAMLAWQLLPAGTAAVVEQIEGSLFQVGATAHVPIEVGAEIREGERVRAGRDGGAVLTLVDGSRIELKARSELAIEKGTRDTTIELERGSVIIQAAERRRGKLYVATDDCLVSVTGTIFSVNHGTKGSRVSVIEGEVRVDWGGDDRVLHPGDQVTTHASLGLLPLDDEIAWSRDADRYLELLGELVVLRREILDRVPRTELRYQSRLLDLMPADTMFFAAVPNLSQTLVESYRVALGRLEGSSALADWWRENDGPNAIQPVLDEIIGHLSEVGGYVGNELAVGAAQSGDDVKGPVVLAELVNGAGLQAFLEQQIEIYTSGTAPLVFLDDPFATRPEETQQRERLWLWVRDDLFVASPDLTTVRDVARIVLEGAANGFVDSDFHRQISALYDEGAGILVAVDLGEVIDRAADGAEADVRAMSRVGFDNVRHLMVEQKRLESSTEHRAVLTFREGRRGVASWLAPPAPMGSLEFISPDAKLVVAFVVKDPAAMLDDVESMLGDEERASFARELGTVEEALGLSLRDDFAAAIGGEVAFAVDGPMLPTPSWKLIVEVYDPARFQWAVEQAIAEMNVQLAEAGEPAIDITREQVGGRTFYTLPARIVEIHYTFVEGYLVASPSRALLDRAIRYRQSGYTLVDAPRFQALLPIDSRDNFSALIYQDLASILQGLVERLGEDRLTAEQRQALAQARPTLAYAYGESDRVIVAATSDGDILSGSLISLLGWKATAESGGIGNLLRQVTGDI